MWFSIYNRLGVHVSASNIDVIRVARTRLKKSARRGRSNRTSRHEFYRQMIAQHASARALYRHVVRGGI